MTWECTKSFPHKFSMGISPKENMFFFHWLYERAWKFAGIILWLACRKLEFYFLEKKRQYLLWLNTSFPAQLIHWTKQGVQGENESICECDTSLLSADGYHVPRGTEIWTNLDAIHMDETLWKNPRTFDPTRFLDEEGKFAGVPPGFKTFGGGRRVCTGEALAKPMLLVRIHWSSYWVALLFVGGLPTKCHRKKIFFILTSFFGLKNLIHFADITSKFLVFFQMLTAVFFQKFSVSAPEGEEVKDEVAEFTLVNIPKPFELMVTTRAWILDITFFHFCRANCCQ